MFKFLLYMSIILLVLASCSGEETFNPIGQTYSAKWQAWLANQNEFDTTRKLSDWRDFEHEGGACSLVQGDKVRVLATAKQGEFFQVEVLTGDCIGFEHNWILSNNLQLEEE